MTIKKEKKVRNTLSSILHPNKTKVSVVKSEILIKCKRIKWTPTRKASLLLPGEKKN